MKQYITKVSKYIRDLYPSKRVFKTLLFIVKNHSIKKKQLRVLLTATIPFCVIWMGSGMFLFDPSGEKQEIVLAAETAVNPSSLTAEEQAIYNNLGAIYQKIYILALNSEERTRVALYVRRGQTPYEAIDVILRSEERKYLRAHPKKTYQSPADKATAKNKATKNYTVY